MRIAVLAPIAHKTPPEHYGPWELMASLVAEGLVKRGHEVTLFATADSATAGKLEAIVPEGLENIEKDSKYVNFKMWEYGHIANCFEKAGQFDIIHNHFNFGPLAFSRLVKTPVVTTVHSGKVEFAWKPMMEMYKKYNDIGHFVAISNSARHSELKYEATVYNGIDINEYEYCDQIGQYLLFLGRIDSDKGAMEAIELAKKTNHKLIIAGIINDRDYFDQKIRPLIDNDQISYIGPVGGVKKSEVVRNAKAMLHLANFDEPFGLTVVESQACGTPVIGYNRGSMPEVICDNKTGMLANNLSEAEEKVKNIGNIKRSDCRKWVEDNFTQEKMVDGYVKVYEKILSY